DLAPRGPGAARTWRRADLAPRKLGTVAAGSGPLTSWRCRRTRPSWQARPTCRSRTSDARQAGPACRR
ncbi:MAG: hypothetical protein FJX62_23980, partial [Alphaproteobacteria bacterium]|nr:hypothetical protein [Alphaproteobacteria bacterium]